MPSNSFWISGSVRSAKTAALMAQLEQWVHQPRKPDPFPDNDLSSEPQGQTVLVFAANAENRSVLMQRIAQQLQGQGQVMSTTPLAFFEHEVQLFWPLVIQKLQLRGFFPYRLRPETELALAQRLWGTEPIAQLQTVEPLAEDHQWVRRILDLIQLAAASGQPLTHLIPALKQSSASLQLTDAVAELIQQLVLQWRDWCLTRGVLTYGLITDLFSHYLLPHPVYQAQLPQRFAAIAADDIDNYPAIAKSLFEQCLKLGLPSLFTYNPGGGIRVGLGADPAYFLSLRNACTAITLDSSSSLEPPSSGADLSTQLQQVLSRETPQLYSLQTISRIQLLQDVGQQIVTAIQTGAALPQEIAIIGPGLDPLAQYTLIETLQQANIPVESLRDQRPLQSSALIRALLTLLTLVYPGLGHLINPEQIAELLVILSPHQSHGDPLGHHQGIDPVRAGLLADYCFRPHPERPELLPLEVYARWDRLGHSVAQAYRTLQTWIAQQHSSLGNPSLGNPSLGNPLVINPLASQPPALAPQKIASSAYLTLNPVFVLDRAIQTFLTHTPLSIDQLAALRELIETAQHYWDIDGRLRKTEPHWPTMPETIESFIQLLRSGVITANPYPASLGHQNRPAVILATTFQYLNVRLSHRWQFWLDAGSQLWQYGGAKELWGGSLFPQHQDPSSNQEPLVGSRMVATITELVERTQERIYLCHSDLSVNGQSQMGPLLPWVETANPLG